MDVEGGRARRARRPGARGGGAVTEVTIPPSGCLSVSAIHMGDFCGRLCLEAKTASLTIRRRSVPSLAGREVFHIPRSPVSYPSWQQ